ncbi:hypothetical protein [Methanobrevibacter sp.]|uniref:hypothetical protein n=1 Tax=Methanobrevibacter sp. TaxID=66852 RepID=UPI00388F3FD1
MKYRKKPVVIEAIQLTRNNRNEIREFVGRTLIGYWCEKRIDGKVYCELLTLEGIMTATEGDYIIKGVQGEFYPCKPDIFEATYEEVQDETR